MSINAIQKSVQLPDGREITIETGKLAKQADGSVVVRQGNTMLLATVVSAKEAKPGTDFLPLSVDYQEKFASAGKIPGGFLKREGKLSDAEVLNCRLIDRALRPLFPSDYHADTQVMVQLVSHDPEVKPDSLAALAASAALTVSDIPFHGPISEVRVARINGEFIVNPSPAALVEADLDLIVAADAVNIMMVEGEMSEVSEEEMVDAMKIAHDVIKTQCAVQKELESAVGKTEKRSYSHEAHDEDLKEKIFAELRSQVDEVVALHSNNKEERGSKFGAIIDGWVEAQGEDADLDMFLVKQYYGSLKKKSVRDHVLETRIRLDGRQLNEIRPIWSEVGYLPSAHGSAVFTRGETQSLTSVTLGTKLDEQMFDGATTKGKEFSKFILHYNFPGFSTGEVRPNRGPGRREVGHGNLAFRAIKKVLPADADNPYTIRVVSDILESNGSSSMATVCAGTLALMDAGIPIKAPVSGIAMGLIMDPETKKYAVLSDILGDEDHLGDMDFKVTGTKKGITACQMDIKVDGLPYEILAEALTQAKEGRLHILDKITETIASPREEMKDHAPRIIQLMIGKDMIGAVIGPGGKVIQEIQAETGTTITIEELDNEGQVSIFGTDGPSVELARKRVWAIAAKPEVGEIYTGKVKAIMPYGAFVEILPGKDGLLHVSEIKWEKVEDVSKVLEEGEEVKVKLVGVDPKSGKLKLSRKVLLPKPEQPEEKATAE
jgi:polyribonucleotide nucleotidyltransferase